MNTIWQDLRYGARMLLKQPGFTLIAVLTLALGIGANTAIFSVVNAVLLRPLPYDKPGALVGLSGSASDFARIGLTELEYAALRNESKSFKQIAISVGNIFTLTSVAEPEAVPGALVSSNYFELLGARVFLGRGFAAAEDQAGKNQVAILSYDLWQRRFGADPGVIGQPLTLGANSFTIIGVLPQGFRAPLDLQLASPIELWAGYGFNTANLNRGSHVLTAIARLQDGVTQAQAEAEAGLILGQVMKANPQVYAPDAKAAMHVLPLHEEIAGKSRPALVMLLAAVITVLLIACANVANLLLARGEMRAAEIAVRTALGASRCRIVRQLLVESLLLALSGGCVGLLLARWGLDALVALSPGNVPRLQEIGLEPRVFLFTLLTSLLASIVFGLAPALRSARTDLHLMLKEGGRTAGGQAGRGWLRSALVVSETAMALILLVCAGLLLRSFWRLQQVETGFNAERLLTMRLIPRATNFENHQQVVDFYERLVTQIGTLPDVQAAAVANFVPLSGDGADRPLQIEGVPYENGTAGFHTDFRRVSPTYFKAMQLRLIKGRYFTDSDAEGSQKVAVINETLARKHWPSQDPLGQRLRLLNGSPEQATAQFMTIVGVVADAKNRLLNAEMHEEVYVPMRQQAISLGGRPSNSMVLIVRSSGNPLSLTNMVRREIWSLDRTLPITQIRTMEQLVDRAVGPPRFNALLLMLFALIALSLGMFGIFGVLSYAVTQRTHEIGIRLALGAPTSDVLRLVIGHGMIRVALGIGIGLAGALALTRLLESLLYGVSASDPLTFGVIALVLALVGLLACWIPARRATKVDPMVALHCE